MRTYLSSMIGLLFLATTTTIVAADKDEMQTIQKKYNTEIMEKEFFAEQPDKVEAYIKESMEKDLKPTEYTGIYWRVGYTCHDLLRYSWREYRDCQYYHRYHGHFYPYP